jgi:hypothetical protein
MLSRAEVTSEIPAGWPPSRYEKMSAKSPFAPATPVVAAPVTPGFAANLYVTGVAKIGDQDYVSIASRDAQQPRFSLLTGETSSSPEGITMLSVEWSDQIGKSKVNIKKGNESAVLEFDQATLQSSAVQVSPQMPQQIQRGGGAMPPGQPGGMQMDSNGQRRIILPNQPGMPPGTQNPPMPAGSDTRRRIRIINSKPQ